jgi:hypothetical protein
MAGVLEVRASVVNFQEEARGCLQLAKAEAHSEVRTVLMGMALGWLKLANGTNSSRALQHDPAGLHHSNG